MSEGKLFKVVSAWDPAIDLEKTKIEEYAGDEITPGSRNFADVHARDGELLTVYYLRELDTPIVNRYILTATTLEERRERAFRSSVVRVENLVIDDVRHDRWTSKRVDKVDRKDSPLALATDLFTDDEANLFEPAVQQEIGEVARKRSFLPRGMQLRCWLPRTSLEILAVTAYLRVEQAKSSETAGTSSDEPADGPTAPAT